MINTLKHRARTVCSNVHLLQEEEDHLNKALKRCKYPDRALSRANIHQKKKKNTNQGTTNRRGNNNKPHIVVPYIQGMGRAAKIFAESMGLISISKELIPSRTSWYTPRTETPS